MDLNLLQIELLVLLEEVPSQASGYKTSFSSLFLLEIHEGVGL
jgi:hypothetical protein